MVTLRSGFILREDGQHVISCCRQVARTGFLSPGHEVCVYEFMGHRASVRVPGHVVSWVLLGRVAMTRDSRRRQSGALCLLNSSTVFLCFLRFQHHAGNSNQPSPTSSSIVYPTSATPPPAMGSNGTHRPFPSVRNNRSFSSPYYPFKRNSSFLIRL